MVEAKPLIPVIVGPTAVGKTAVAHALARHWPVTVVSADSRQTYRGLDIGTGKPGPDVLADVPHLGIDILDPDERYSAGRFARDAAVWLAEIGPDRQPLVVGGTGFYVRALADGLFREPPMDQKARASFRRWASGAKGLAGWAARLDPEFSGGGRQRAARTVEIALLTGRSLSWWQRHAGERGVMQPWYVRLTAPRTFLHRRISLRIDEMLANGWIEEVERLLAAGLSPTAPAFNAVGYREIVADLTGSLPREKLVDGIVAATRRYAKRQETWFRHQLGSHAVMTLDATVGPDELAERIAKAWNDLEVRCG